MKEFTKYLIWAGVGLVALAGLINYFMVKSHNDKIINDSLEKARKAKKAKAEKDYEFRWRKSQGMVGIRSLFSKAGGKGFFYDGEQL